MSNKKLAVLAIVAAGMVVWAVVQSNISNRRLSSSGAGAYLLQGIEPSEIGSIVVQAEGNTVTLSRQGNNFVVIEKSNYPAKTGQINRLITSCLDVQTNELITSNKSNFAELGVSDDKPERAVKFFKTDNKSVIAGILIGKASKDMQGTYVRQLSSDKTYLSANVPELQTKAMDYIDKNLTEVSRGDVVKVDVSDPDGSYVITDEPNRGVILEKVPAGKRAKTSDVELVVNALAHLQFDDVKKDSGDVKFDKTYSGQLKDSTVYTLNLASNSSKTYAKCTADFLDKSEVLKKNTVESQEVLKANEAKLLARDKAEAFAKKTQGWIYEISEMQARNLTMKFADLIENEPNKPVEPSKPADANSVKQ